MKVNELFEAGGALYKPRYDDDRKHQVGSVADWLETMGITKDDIAVALKKFKETEIFKKAAHGEHGIRYKEIATSEKKGTLTFDTDREYSSGHRFVGSYKIYANGLIRYSAPTMFIPNKDVMTRLQSPKPRMRAGDPVGSLVRIWSDALKEVMRKWEKAVKRGDSSYVGRGVK